MPRVASIPKVIARRMSGDSCEEWSKGAVAPCSGFSAGGEAWAGGIRAGKKLRPLWDRIWGVWNQGVGGADLLCVYRFIPACPHRCTRPPGPCNDGASHQGGKMTGERHAGHAGTVGHCARR